MIKRIFLTILIITTVGLCFRGCFYRHLIRYESLGIRRDYSATEADLTNYYDVRINKKTNLDIGQIVKLSLSITSDKLTFTADHNDNDPNKLINTKTAHCVGYASFFSTTCNYLLKKYNLDDTWTAKPQIGQLYLLGTNIHQYFNSPFLKDHDFVAIENKQTGQILAVDPTVNDYFHIDFITYISNEK